MLDNINKTIEALCEFIQKEASKKSTPVQLAETTKALADLLIARAHVIGTIQ